MDRNQNRSLDSAKSLGYRAISWAKRLEPEGARSFYAMRRAAFIARMKLQAAWQGGRVDIEIAPDVRLGKDIAITVWPGSHTVFRIGPGARIGDRVLFFLNGGRCDIGNGVEIRRDCVFMIWGGSLELGGENIVNWGSVFHCASSIRIGRLTGIGECVTIIDSSHYYTTPDRAIFHNNKLGPIEIGENSLIGAKATIARNSKIGAHCMVAGNSVVTGEVPAGHLVSGVPAQIVRELELPWEAPAPAPGRPRRASEAKKPQAPGDAKQDS
ncbi:MAG: acyltransferase [Actinomycetota bacterium]